jgi:hypothetical protein
MTLIAAVAACDANVDVWLFPEARVLPRWSRFFVTFSTGFLDGNKETQRLPTVSGSASELV